MSNPFKATYGEYVDVSSRISCVARFSLAECRAALKVSGLQKTVKAAIDRRMDQLVDHHHRRKAKGRMK